MCWITKLMYCEQFTCFYLSLVFSQKYLDSYSFSAVFVWRWPELFPSDHFLCLFRFARRERRERSSRKHCQRTKRSKWTTRYDSRFLFPAFLCWNGLNIDFSSTEGHKILRLVQIRSHIPAQGHSLPPCHRHLCWSSCSVEILLKRLKHISNSFLSSVFTLMISINWKKMRHTHL